MHEFRHFEASKRQRIDRLLGLVAVATIIIAWILGAMVAEQDVFPFLQRAVPAAQILEPRENSTYAAFESRDLNAEPKGFVAVGEGGGYGGPMKLAVATDRNGRVSQIIIISQKETQSFLRRVFRSDFLASLLGKSYSDPFILNEDIDGVSGATYTSRALAAGVKDASRRIAAGPLQLSISEETPAAIKFGLPEFVLLALYAVGFGSYRRKFRYKKVVRWISMLTGLLVLGFLYNSPLTLANINSFLLGFWPSWHTHLYWYLLIGGVVFVFIVGIKSPYCEWFCPFGAAQECFGAIGGARVRTPLRYHEALKWSQRFLAWFAVIIALLFRNPGLPSYEVFGTLFSLTGSALQFILLAIVLVAALFIKRPWCNFLCPLRPATELLTLFRNWANEIWLKLKANRIV